MPEPGKQYWRSVTLSFGVAALWLALACVPAASSGTFLDDYLRTMKIDARSPERTADRAHQFLTAPKAFGQTFVTGPEVEEIRQIAIQCPHANPDWTEGTSLVLALYDSPGKATELGRFEMKYEWRMWEDMTVVFPLGVRAEPGREYYFELTAQGGNGSIGPILTASGDYPSGQAYIDGKPQDFDFVFEVYAHTKWDRDQAYRSAFAAFDLNHPEMGAVRAAAEAARWEEAARALVAHFEARPEFQKIASQEKGRTIPDLSTADLAANMSVRDAEGGTISLGPNWNHLRWWPTRGGVGLTRDGIRKHLAAGYFNTRDPKYAVAWNDMLKAVLKDLPSPLKSGVVPPGARDIPPINPGGISGGSMWSGLAIGARLAHEFYYYAIFADSPDFTWDVRAAFIVNFADMMDVLAIQKAGGNWTTQMYDHLFYFSTEFPEYARSREYAELAFNGMLENMRETLLPDGPIGESAGYQMMVHGQYLDVLDRAEQLGIATPPDVVASIERALAFHMLTMQPDGQRPAFGDALGDDPKRLLARGADKFARQDMRWAATDGSEGHAPAETSVEFGYSKYYVMRSDWSPEARYLCLKNGRYTAHGHFDSLGFVLCSYGNPLIVDPGIYIYGTPEAIKLISTQSHSTISVDGANLHNGGGPSQFSTGATADYLVAVGPNYQRLDESIYPVRRIAFVKPDYWVISDIVRGSGEHQVDSRFHFADTLAQLDEASQWATTRQPAGGNLAIIPTEPGRIRSSLDDGHTAYVHEKREPALILRQSAKTELPFRIDNVLYPYEGAAADARVTPLGAAGAEVSGTRVETAGGIDWIVFTDRPIGEAAFEGEQLHASAQCAVIRADGSGSIRGFSWMWGRELRKGMPLASAQQPIASLDVVYDGDTVRVAAKGEDASLRIAALGRSRFTVNGGPARPIEAEGGMFGPIAGKGSRAVLVDDEFAGFAIERPVKGSTAGGGDQVGFSYQWAHVSPGRVGLYAYTAGLPRPGLYEVRAYIPTFELVETTREARYIVSFSVGGRWAIPAGGHVVSVDRAAAGEGSVGIVVDQAGAAGSWVSLGIYEFEANVPARLEILSDAPTGGPVVLADAVMWVPVP